MAEFVDRLFREHRAGVGGFMSFVSAAILWLSLGIAPPPGGAPHFLSVRGHPDDRAHSQHSYSYDKFMNDASNDELREEVERLEEEAVRESDYKTRAEHGEEQSEHPQAVDFTDAPGPRLRVYNCCRARARHDARLGEHCPPRLRFPK